VFVSVPFETDLSQFGIATYSEYVNRGFGELILSSVLIYGLLWAGLLSVLLWSQKGKQNLLGYVHLVLFGEIFLFLASLFRRIWLYQQYHGWSLARIYGGFFLLGISGMFITLALRHRFKKNWIYMEGIIVGILILVLGAFNAEEFIVKNHPPTVNKRVDHIYLSRMSPDGYLGWDKAYEYAQKVLSENGLDQKIVISKEDRREVAYAGLVVRNISEKYEDLLHQYATPTEIRDYYRQLISEHGGYLASGVGTDREGQKNFQEAIQEIQKEDGDIIKIGRAFTMPRWYDWVHFQKDQKSQYEFYSVWKNDYTYRYFPEYGRIDKIFLWNQAEKKAFEHLKEHIPYTSLFTLQSRFYELFDKIASQGKDEQSYDSDISLRSPFVD
jgi:hypothetical protein